MASRGQLSFLLLLCCCSTALSQKFTPCVGLRFINVGVEDNTTFTYLNSIKDTLTPSNATGPQAVFFNFTYLPVGTLFPNVADIFLLEFFLLTQGIHVIIADYYQSIAVVAYSYNIPYFVTGVTEFSDLEYRQNMFRFQIDHNELNNTLSDWSTALQRQGYVIYTDGSVGSSHFTKNVAGKIFFQSVINENTTDNEIFNSLTTNKGLMNSSTWVLVYEPNNLFQIERIFNQSAGAGILTNNDVFIIPSLEEKQQYLMNVRQSEAVIYTFALQNSQRYNETELSNAYLRDCLAHLAASAKNCKTSSANLTLVTALINTSIQGDTGFFSYRNGIRYGLTINVMAVDKLLPASNFLTKTGTWVQGNVPPYIVDYIKSSSIKGSLVRFAAVDDRPYIYRNLNGELTGLSYDLILLMQKNLQFQFEIIFVPDQSYGTKLASGNWTGIVKYLVENKADMSGTFLSATAERLVDVDIATNMVQSGLQMMVRRSVQKLDFFNVFYPFSWFVWISIVFSLIVLSVTLFVSDKISPNKRDTSMFTFMGSFFLVLSSFLMSKVETEPRRPSARLFTLLLWFSTLFYMTTYLSNLVPFLVKPDDSLPFSTIADLENVSNYRAIFVNSSVSMTMIEQRWPALVKRAKANWPADAVQPTSTDAVRVLQTKENYVVVDYVTTILYEKIGDCSLKAYGPIENVMYEVMMFSRAFPYKDEVRAYLNSIQFTDFQNLQQKYYGLDRCPSSIINPADKVPLSFNYFAGIFSAVGIGAVLGFLYMILHWIYRKICLLIARSRGRIKLKYGDEYEAEILKITKEGIWVKIEKRQEVFFIANNSLHSDPTKVKSAKNLKLRVRQKIPVQYFGKDSATNNRIFARLFEESEWVKEERNQAPEEDSD